MIFPFLSSIRTLAQEPPEKVLIPMGGGYTDLYPGLMSAILSRSRSEVIQIAVLPAAYASNPETISQSEREDNLLAAEGRRAQIEDACRKAAGRKLPCEVNLAPVFTRADAQDPANVAFITPNLDAVFLLGGDQTIAMQVLADTPMESALQSAYEAGVIIAGTSAGAGVMATNMLGGYAEDFSTESSLQFGSVDLWNKELRRGLSFGLKSAIIDQHFFQLGRPGRLLSAIIQPDSPHVGIGLDAFTGVEISDDEVVGNAFGRYTYAIFDAKTFHSAQTVHYYPPENTLSVRNVLVHLLAPGDSTYNLVTRQHSLEAAPERVERDFEMLSLPQGAGNLILYGGHLLRAAKDPTLPGFLNMSGGSQANILLILAGYASRAEAQEAEAAWRQSLTIDPGIKVDSIQLTSRMTETIELSGNYTGIILTGEDQSQIPVETLRNVRVAWMAGMPILAENAAAAVVGSYYSASRPNGPASEDYANNAQKVFLQNVAPLQPGLGLIPAMIEPQLLVDNRWGNLFALAYNHPETVALGITEGAIIELSGGEAFVRGNNPVVALDFRQAKLSLGTNDGFVVANGLLDVFTPGDHLRPEVADVNITPIQAPTPEFTATATASPTPTATPAPTATITSTPTPEPPTPTPKGWRPTRTPRPTSTPLTIPPPTDKNSLNAMIFFCVLAVIVVVVGVIINRTRQA